MKWILVLVVGLLFVGTASATPVNFTDWAAYGDAWKANNDTHTLIKWNATGDHTWLSTNNATTVDYLVVAGGGGGGGYKGSGNPGGGGGGSGAMLTGSALPVSGSVNVTVGTSGAGGIGNNMGGNGGNSSFSNITPGDGINAYGGGGGGSYFSSNNGRNGGSGGGAAYTGLKGSALGLGGNDGNVSVGDNSKWPGGGGGGAGSAGFSPANYNIGGSGGLGLQSSITGTSVYYAGGGGGGIYTGGTGGSGGSGIGGAGGVNSANGGNGLINTGSGGGGAGSSTSTAANGGSGGSGIVIISYLSTPPPEPPVASFICAQTSTTLGTPISCTDTSSDTPTNWTYYWGDGNVTDGTQNPSYTYPFTGTFSINQTVNNTLGSSWYNRSNYITITNITYFTQQDIYLTGQYTITFNAKSSTTNLPIANVTVVDSVSGQSYPSTNGTAFLTLPAGLYYVNFIADGYQSKQVTYVVDQDETHEVKLTPSAPGSEPVYNVYPPKDVKFHITSFFGAPIANASVTIQGITTSTGNWDWVITLLGISLNEVAINGTAMTETTDSNGDAVFLMLPSVKYNITTTAPGYTFPTSFIAPQATEYTIAANWNESWFSSGNDTLKDVNVSVSWVKYNDTYSFVNITYDDQTMTTTGGTITVYRDSTARVANASAISTMDITSSSCSNSTLVNTPTGGASYKVQVNATTTSGENVVRTFTHSFKGAPVTLPGWTPETLLWLSLFIIIFTAAFAGALHAPQMSVILCVEAWVFWSIGWLDYLISWNGYAEGALLIVLTVATFFTVIWSITEGKAKGKRSS